MHIQTAELIQSSYVSRAMPGYLYDAQHTVTPPMIALLLVCAYAYVRATMCAKAYWHRFPWRAEPGGRQDE